MHGMGNTRFRRVEFQIHRFRHVKIKTQPNFEIKIKPFERKKKF